jgi:hypothetical protein
VGVGQALGLHVARPIQIALDETLAATEGGHRLAGGGLERLGHLAQLPRHLEPATAAAERGLDRDRQPVLGRERLRFGRVGDRVSGAGDQWSADLLRDVPSPHLVAQRLDRLRRRADPDQPGVGDGPGEVGVLGQEAVTRVHGIGAAPGRDVEQCGDVEVGLGRGSSAQGVRLVGEPGRQPVGVRVGVDRHAAEPRIRRRPDHPDSDLSPIGDKHLADSHATSQVCHRGV